MNSRTPTTVTKDPTHIKLIAMPWALFNRPSIQLGTLKAYLESRNSGLLVETSHNYLAIASVLGPELYHWISMNPWVSEALYAPLVFPAQAEPAEILAMKYAKKATAGIKRSFQYSLLLEKLRGQLKELIDVIDWGKYALIGFSVCFHQLFASLAAARAIKEKHPQVIMVFGGSSCGADAGRSLLKAFPFIDYIVAGEGEDGLLALSEHVSGFSQVPLPDNILTRQKGCRKERQSKNKIVAGQLSSLEKLPAPDYDDYFSEQKKYFPQMPFIPVLPIEFSRGCWWNKCTFCNLNLQWCGYRAKKSAHMLREVKSLAARYGCLDFTFVDNMLPPKEALKFFRTAAEDSSDFSFFAEIRSSKGVRSPADIFSTYRRGGLSTIQVGIEALSSSLLQKMRKGISVIENIATIRAAQENGLQLEGNLILQFPGSTEAEAAETLMALDYVFPFYPLTAATFFLSYQSPIFREPQKYGIRAIINHANNTKLFPKPVLATVSLLVKDYRGDREQQRRIWQPVSLKIQSWQQYHKNRKENALQKPLLSYRDGTEFLLIRQELPDGKILHHRLRSTSRKIYLFCTQIRKEEEILKQFPAVPPEKLHSFLHDLRQKRILFSEKNEYLALAVHCRD